MKRLLGKLIRLLGCMTMLLFLTGLIFGIFLEKEDIAGFLGAIGGIAGLIFVFTGFIHTVMIPWRSDSEKMPPDNRNSK